MRLLFQLIDHALLPLYSHHLSCRARQRDGEIAMPGKQIPDLFTRLWCKPVNGLSHHRPVHRRVNLDKILWRNLQSLATYLMPQCLGGLWP